ncbi:hypothetical protein C8J57DRAFT_1288775 [Mycena rebaudengoi]|nr:hypothetical protein C8J57DRAFT_1288775 [Mycena rebaudengoi]
MSFSEPPQSDDKKRRLRGACDICRRQKVRCDRAKMPNKVCSNCVTFNSECVRSSQLKLDEKIPRRKRAGDPTKTTIEVDGELPPHLEKARFYVEAILSETKAYQAPQDRDALIQLLVEISRYARKLELDLAASEHKQGSDPSSSQKSSPPSDDLDEDDDSRGAVDVRKLPEHLKGLVLDSKNLRSDKATHFLIIRDALAPEENPESAFVPVSALLPCTSRGSNYWTAYPEPPEPPVIHEFPPDDILRDLVELYFTQVHIHALILHRPTFEKSVAEGLHLQNPQFGATVLAVCAVASKHSTDPRVHSPGARDERSAGSQWFNQIRRPFCGPVNSTMSLYELQLCCLFILYEGRNPVGSLLLGEFGMLHEQEIGNRRHKDPSRATNAEDEMYKRCFSFLYTFDVMISACLGRARLAISFSDTDLPVLCDDEYWETADPSSAFKQPPGKPSLTAYHISLANLTRIFSLAWRPKDSLENFRGQHCFDRATRAEIDSRLKQWIEDIPEHLQWNPYMENDSFFDQSSTLYAMYYLTVILVHRPTLSSADRTLSASIVKSLAICTSAARAFSHVADVKCRRGSIPNTYILKSALDCAITLLLNISAFKRAGLPVDPDKELQDVYKLMRLIQQAARRSHNAAAYHYMLTELMAIGKFPPPPPDDDDVWDVWFKTKKPKAYDGIASSPPVSWPQDFSSLPMGAEDLSRLSMYGALNFSFGSDEPALDMDALATGYPVTDPAPQGYPTSTTQNGSFARMFDEEQLPFISDWVGYFYSMDDIAMAQVAQNGPADALR